MDTTEHNETWGADQPEDILDADLQRFIDLASSLAVVEQLPEKLRRAIGEAARAAHGCKECRMPLGALHSLECSETGREWRYHGLRREVAAFDLDTYGPHDVKPTRAF